MIRQTSTTTLDWVHPSWRDVVIDHLMRHPDDRRRFLRRCAMVGLELALSDAGGATGEREQPLLRTDDDWLELRRRMLELLPEQEQAGHRLLLESLHASLESTDKDGVLYASVEEAGQELCVAVVAEWDRRGEPLGVRTLESFYGLSVLLSRLPAGPQLRPSVNDWLNQLDRPPEFFPQESVAGLALVAENEPRALRQAGWPDAHPERIAVLFEAAGQTLSEAEAVRATLSGPEPPELEDVQYHGYEVFRWRQVMRDLKRAGGDSNKSGTLTAQLASVGSALERWSEQKEQEAEDRAAEMAGEWDPEDDEYEGDEPDAFSIEAVLGDL